MTVQATTTKTTQNCNGSLTDFSFNFAIYKQEDLAVIVRTPLGNEYLLVLGTDYAVSSDDFDDGGVVSTIKEVAEEFVPYAYPANCTITIMLNIALTQETDLLYGGTFSAEAIEKMSDKLTRILQQLNEQLGRSIKFQKSSDQESVEIEDLEAGKFIVVNDDGDGLEMGEVAGEPGQSPVSNVPYNKDTWDGKVDIAPSKNAVRDEWVNNRFTKGGTYATVMALSHGEFSALPVSNIAYGASWATIVDTAASKKAIYDKIEAMGGGAGDVVGPATNTDDHVPQWNGADSKTLKNGFAITAAGKALIDDADAVAQRTTLGLGSAALRTAENVLTDGSNLPDGAAIKTYGDANWGGGGDVGGPASAVNDAVPLFDGVTGKLIKDSARLIEDALTDGSNLPDGHAIKIYGDANWGGNYTNLTEFIAQTAWRLFYSNAAGDVTELVLGAAGQYLKANGVTSAPTWAVPGGAGDVVGPATHAADYVPQWNGTPDSKVLVAGFAITAAGKALMDDADAAAQRTTLGLGSAALRTAEDTLTDGSNLPDGHAIKIYGDANWSGSPGGADTQIQFNNSGAFGGDADFTWTSATNILNLVNAEIQSLDDANADFTLDSSPLVGAWSGWTYRGANVIKVKQAKILPTNGSSHYFIDGLQVNHYDGDTTNYQTSATQHEMHCCNLDMTGIVSSIQYKDMIGLSVRVLGRIGWAARGVSAITCETKQFGTGIASNEFHVMNPAAAEGGHEQSTSMAGLQLVTKPHHGDEDGSHIYRGLMIDNFGKRITHGIYMSSNTDGYGNGDIKNGLSMDNATVTATAIIMPASRTGHVGTIIEYAANDYSYFDRGNNRFGWTVGGNIKLSIDSGGIFTTSGNIETHTFGQAFKGKDQGGSMLNLAYAGATGYAMIGAYCNYTNIGAGSSQANPVIIRVNGVDGKQISVGAVNSGGSGYRMLRVEN